MSDNNWFWTILVLLVLGGSCLYSTVFADQGATTLDATPIITTNTVEVTATAVDFGTGQKSGLWLNFANDQVKYSNVFVHENQHIIITSGAICADVAVALGTHQGVLVPLGSEREWALFVIKHTGDPNVTALPCGYACNNGGVPAHALMCPGAGVNIPATVPASRVVYFAANNPPCNVPAGYLDKCTFYCNVYSHCVAVLANKDCNPNSCTLYVCTGLNPANATPCVTLTTEFPGGDRPKVVVSTDSSGCPVNPEVAACDFYCNAAFHKSGNACIPNTCAPIPPQYNNVKICSSINTSPAVDQTVPTYEAFPCNDTSQACKFGCLAGFVWDGSNCRSPICHNPQPLKSTRCTPNPPAIEGADWNYVASCGAVPCTYSCNAGYHIPDCAGKPDGTLCADDGNQCTDDKCAAQACTHPNKVNGTVCDDGNPLTCGEKCTAGVCGGGGACAVCVGQPDNWPCTDDGNQCTDDKCVAQVCTHPNKVNGTVCDDGNPLTCGEKCTAGVCGGGGLCGGCLGQPDGTACPDDGNQCTDDKCVAQVCTHPNKTNGTACNDSIACTYSDQCTNGSCGGTPYTCNNADQCHNNPGTCDGSGGCTYPNKANGTTCNDGNAATCGETCTAGVCGGGVACTACTGQPDSTPCTDDGNQCTNDICVSQVCTHPNKANGTACDADGSACTTPDTCQGGACTAGPAVVCVALDQCHNVGTCNAVTGICSNPNKANGTTCNDGNAATCGETCTAGVCGGGVACTDCSGQPDTTPCTDDGNQCTNDICVSQVCTHPNKTNGTGCNDSDSCTSSDHCWNGSCVGTAYSCNSANQCQNNPGTCDGSGGCTYTNKANGTGCNDSDPCTSSDHCTNGSCGGTSYTCNSGDQCHNNPGTCDGSGGCTYTNKSDGTGCNDSNNCTYSDHCTSGSCGGTSYTCNGGNQCQVNPGTCDGSGGCSYADKPNGTGCNDSNDCTHTDQCMNGGCSGTSYTCTGGNQCQNNPGTCDGSGGCTYTNKGNGTGCDDGNASTSGETCQNGACTCSSCGCSLPWGGTINDGGSVTAYASDFANCPGAGCISETRTCTNGSLSGSYGYASCTQEEMCTTPQDCCDLAPSWLDASCSYNAVAHCRICGGCFVAGTKIATPKGPVPIEKLKVGDIVYSVDPEKKTRVPGKVTKTHRRVSPASVIVTLSNGNSVHTTTEHPFYLPDTGTYKKLGEIHAGDRVLWFGEGGQEPVVVSIKTMQTNNSPVEVYNLTVESDFHNYIANGVLVHNKYGCVVCTPQNCMGAWDTTCSNTCGTGTLTYHVTMPANSCGADCPYADGATQSCTDNSGCCTCDPPNLVVNNISNCILCSLIPYAQRANCGGGIYCCESCTGGPCTPTSCNVVCSGGGWSTGTTCPGGTEDRDRGCGQVCTCCCTRIPPSHCT